MFMFLKINNRLNSRCSFISVFEKKGFVRILVFMLNNQNSIDSKYKLKKLVKINNATIDECLKIMKIFELIDIKKDIGPRNRTEVKLTNFGIKIAQSIEEILILLNDKKTYRFT